MSKGCESKPALVLHCPPLYAIFEAFLRKHYINSARNLIVDGGASCYTHNRNNFPPTYQVSCPTF